MKHHYNRRNFLKSSAIAGLGLGLTFTSASFTGKDPQVPKGKRVGIIGLDTSHSIAFTKALNNPDAGPELRGYKVVAAYPKGSNDIESSVKRIPANTEEIQKYDVRIVNSIKELLSEVDVVMLETNDGRPHLEQALQVLKSGKRMFIDKPIAASLTDVVKIFEAAKDNNVPIFTASSLRYMPGAQEVAQGKIGKVLGADTYSPATLEKTHPDLFWYGIHGVETLFTVMGMGCKSVSRVNTDKTDVVVGIWGDGRVGTFRGTRSGTHGYGGTVFGENGNIVLGPYGGYNPLLEQIVKFFETGQPPVSADETIEIFAFMEAADESKRQGGIPVTLDSVKQKAARARG